MAALSPILFVLDSVAIFLNLLLLLVYYKCPVNGVGAYKPFFLFFAIVDIGFASLHLLLIPVFTIDRNVGALLSIGPLRYFALSQFLLIGFSAFFMAITLLIGKSFVYRYIHLCRISEVNKFYSRNKNSVLKQVISNALFAINWMFIVIFALQSSSSTNALLKEHVSNIFSQDIDQSAYFAVVFSGLSRNPVRLALLIEFIVFHILITVLVVYCSVCIMKVLRANRGVSNRANRIHQQLFRLLCYQCILPVFSMYLPSLLIMASPLFGLSLPPECSFASAVLNAVFPLANPVLIILFVRDYRHFVLKCGSVNSRTRITTTGTRFTDTPVRGSS